MTARARHSDALRSSLSYVKIDEEYLATCEDELTSNEGDLTTL